MKEERLSLDVFERVVTISKTYLKNHQYFESFMVECTSKFFKIKE